MYSLSTYGDMLADAVRMEAFERSLRQTVKPGMVALEIGTGPGILPVLISQLGAKRVYAIEASPVIQVARQIAAANHCADKIEFIEGNSIRVSASIQADVIFSDLRGVLPLLADHIPSIVDARRRFLAPGGRLIALKDQIWVAVVEAPERYAKIARPWETNSLGQDRSPARRMIVNSIYRMHPKPQQLLTRPEQWASLDYSRIEDPDVQGELRWTAERDGTGHGIVIWFDSELAEGVCLLNSPWAPETIYGSMFLPWQEPVPLVAGQAVCVHLHAKLIEEDYSWRWTTHVGNPDGPGETKAHFDQSLLKGALLSPATLRKGTSVFVPQLSRSGLARRRALELMDGRTSLEEISRRLTEEFPDQFRRWQHALSFAGAISCQDGQ
jgi:protein arginine N-methyltransferase 1